MYGCAVLMDGVGYTSGSRIIARMCVAYAKLQIVCFIESLPVFLCVNMKYWRLVGVVDED